MKQTDTLVKPAILTFTISGILFAVLTALVINGITKPFDQSVLLWINQHVNNAFDAFFLAVTQLGGVFIIGAVTLALVLYFVLKKKYYKAAFIALSVGGVSVINVLLKTIFDRPRPDLWEWLVTETSFSFPSGHSVASAALALSIVTLLWQTKWRVLTIVLAALYVLTIGFSRMYLGVHFPTDVLGGWLLGATWVSLVASVLYLLATYNRLKGRAI